ncbi:MAG: nuclear transport factor 2 family protein [Pseudomonadota bacterium]
MSTPTISRSATRGIIAAALVLLSSLVSPWSWGDGEDLSAIRAAVFDYFEGINEVSEERLRRAFDASASMKNVGEDGSVVARPIDEVIARWLTKTPETRTGEILSIDVTDGEIARVVFDYNGNYVDFLTLAKVRGEWKIIDKVFVTR